MSEWKIAQLPHGLPYIVNGHGEVVARNLETSDAERIIAAVAALEHQARLVAENERLLAELEDARETLRPFEDASLPGYDAGSNRPVTIVVTEGELCQAWQVLTNRKRWRPAAPTRP